MSVIPQPLSGLAVVAGQLFLAAFQLPFGVVVGAVTERFSRRLCSDSNSSSGVSHSSYARVPSTAIKLLVACLSLSFVLWDHRIRIPLSLDAFTGATSASPDKNRIDIDIGMLIFLVMRVLFFAAGTAVGAAFQPVGLTGGIATGKSTVSSLLLQSPSQNDDNNNSASAKNNEKGMEMEDTVEFIIIDVDGIAHDILLPKKLGQDSVYDRLVSEFGTGILTKEEGENNHDACPNIDRRKLGDLVFPDRQKRRKLNSITHPTIIKIMLKRILYEGLNLGRFFSKKPTSKKDQLRRRRVVCVDIPLLFEGGLPMKILFGTVIVVACNATLQLERLHKRNSDLTLEQCRQRIASQIPVEEKARKAQVVIRNDEDLNSLKRQVRQVKERVTNVVSGPQRGIELSWLVIGVGGFFFLKQYLHHIN